MKKFIAIGLGNFGFNLAKQLEENGCEVLGIDMSREVVEKAKDLISHSVIGDASNKDVLVALKLKDFDGAIVSIGQDMAPSILIALYLQEIGLKNIIVRAVSEDHAKILEKIGSTKVIFPETDAAVKLANKLANKNLLDYLPLSDEHGIVEVAPPKSFIGQCLKDLQIAGRFHCQVVAIKYIKDNTLLIPPSADDVITADSIMIIIGKIEDITEIEELK